MRKASKSAFAGGLDVPSADAALFTRMCSALLAREFVETALVPDRRKHRRVSLGVPPVPAISCAGCWRFSFEIGIRNAALLRETCAWRDRCLPAPV